MPLQSYLFFAGTWVHMFNRILAGKYKSILVLIFYTFSFSTLHSLILYEGEERENNIESLRRTCPEFCSTEVKQDQNSDSKLCSNAYLITLCKMWKPAQEVFRGLPAQNILALFWNVIKMGQWRSLKSSRVHCNARLLRKSRAPLPYLCQEWR